MDIKDLAFVMRRRREELGITQAELAERSSIHLRSINLLESGKANPSWDTLQKLTEVLKMEIIVRHR
jgi:transcriptional regulator with XRE-family HTH domain